MSEFNKNLALCWLLVCSKYALYLPERFNTQPMTHILAKKMNLNFPIFAPPVGSVDHCAAAEPETEANAE